MLKIAFILKMTSAEKKWGQFNHYKPGLILEMWLKKTPKKHFFFNHNWLPTLTANHKQRKKRHFWRQIRKQRKDKVLTDLKDDDEGQTGSQDVPELQGELVGLWAPGWSPVVPVAAESGLIGHAHLKHRQAAVHVASQTPWGNTESEGGWDLSSNHDTVQGKSLRTKWCLLVLLVLHTRAVLEGVDKARDVVWGDGDDKGIGDDREHADAFQDSVPDTCWVCRLCQLQ